MISFVRGILTEKTPTAVVVEMNGFGLSVYISLSTFEKLSEIGDQVYLHTHFHVREDAMALYGFSSLEERELFLFLLSVSGIGPKLAMGILSGSKVSELYQAIADGNETRLTKIKGLGKKTAQRLIIELKDKAEKRVGETDITAPAHSISVGMFDEVLMAMMSLGYSKAEAEKSIAKATQTLGKVESIEDLLRTALNS